ncbi:CBS domain-containing protein [Thermocatellispora tengchongensis]|uniref:CBS domain-containing protein n=1 Tax=Thermocatellispora tengchongensis TaxID=1073253 RepID=A0A840PCV2_9ACTN|nr:CBS domain-containing protein [Thermocatellispora tengchongensis]MBB5135763.1 CBS domain-containing protein [Thermocatellispora tengchongensis]
MTLQVKDVMGRVAIAVTPDAGFADIVAAMKRYAVGAVTVIDAGRRPIGVVSADDLLLKETDTARHSTSMYEDDRAREEHRKAAAMTAAELMTTPALTVTPDTPVREAARLMHRHRVKQLPVVDPGSGRIAGTLHQVDALRVFTRPAAELEAEIRAVIADIGLDPASFSIGLDGGVAAIAGRVARSSQAIQLVRAVQAVEGVIDVVAGLTPDRDDIVTAPGRRP